MAANTNPIFSKVGDFGFSPVLTLAANDYTGQGVNNVPIYAADATNGGFVQKLRFKALGTNVATVARLYINNGLSHLASSVAAVSGTPTGTPSGTGGTLATGSYFAKVYAVDQYGGVTAASTETASVSVTGPTGSIAWAWTAVVGAVSYKIVVGMATGAERHLFTSNTNSYSQTAPAPSTTDFEASDVAGNNNAFYGEVSLPATTLIATAATIDIDYPMNLALPPGGRLICGLGTAVAAGWVATVIAGRY